jgi:hypothetical protein
MIFYIDRLFIWKNSLAAVIGCDRIFKCLAAVNDAGGYAALFCNAEAVNPSACLSQSRTHRQMRIRDAW